MLSFQFITMYLNPMTKRHYLWYIIDKYITKQTVLHTCCARFNYTNNELGIILQSKLFVSTVYKIYTLLHDDFGSEQTKKSKMHDSWRRRNRFGNEQDVEIEINISRKTMTFVKVTPQGKGEVYRLQGREFFHAATRE